MRNKIYLIFFVLLASVKFVRAQTDFQKTDSISIHYFNLAKWKDLIDFGKKSIAKGDDFPDLRLRIAYAALQMGNYSFALQNYQQVLKADHYNQTALYYSYLCNTYLNQPREAAFLVANIDGKSVDGVYIKPTNLTQIGVETALKFTDNLDRGNSNFTRIYAQLRASYQFYIDYSILFYNQPIRLDRIRQSGNHLKISYMPIKNLSIISAWNYSVTKFLVTSSTSNTLLFGIRYTKPFYRAQGDISFTNEPNNKAKQSNFQLMLYPLGNLNFYLNNRVSYLNAKDINSESIHSFIYSPTIGIKPLRNVWTELTGTFGKQYNYVEADGLYQYNGLDETRRKFSSNVYHLVKKQLLLGLGYTLEEKTDRNLNFNYLQHSINAGITWNF